MAIKKLLNENNQENTVVHVVFTSPKDPKREEYECVGALVVDEKDMVRIAFSTKNDVVEEYIDIQRADIVGIDVVDDSKIKKL
ncbi:MAG: hypothetical protein WBC83_03275 [Minisyncoccia bacterium]